MKALATSQSARLSAGAVLALAAALLAPSRAAAAGCGDPRGPYHGDMPAASPGEPPLPAPHNPRPCSGPHCSASFPLPLPTAPPAPPGSELWGLPASAAAVPGPAAGQLRFEHVPDRPARQTSSVYRPPR